MTSFYFEDLSERYNSELDDLRTDSENKNVLNRRLQEKRQCFSDLMPMIEDAPEMVAPALHGAYAFNDRKILDRAANSSPGLGRFPRWAEMERTLDIQPWARPLIEMCLGTADGDAFLTSTAVLEWMLTEDIRRPEAAGDVADADEDDTEDLADAGESWMSEQGFDTPDR